MRCTACWIVKQRMVVRRSGERECEGLVGCLWRLPFSDWGKRNTTSSPRPSSTLATAKSSHQSLLARRDTRTRTVLNSSSSKFGRDFFPSFLSFNLLRSSSPAAHDPFPKSTPSAPQLSRSRASPLAPPAAAQRKSSSAPPRSAVANSHAQQMATDSSKCIVYTYNQRSIATSRPATLTLALVKAHLLFPELPAGFSLLLEMDIAGVQAEILEDAWSSPRLWKESVRVQVRVRTPIASGSGSRMAEETGLRRAEEASVEGKGKEVRSEPVGEKAQGPTGGSASGKKKALKKKKAAAAASQGGLLAARNGGRPTMTPEAFASEFGTLDPYTPVSIHVTGPPGDVAIKARANMSFSRVFEAYSNESEAPMDTFHCYWRGMKLVGKDSFIVLLKRFPDLVVDLSEDQSFKVVTVQKGGNPHL